MGIVPSLYGQDSQAFGQGPVNLANSAPIERDIENAIPDKATPIVTYCGGGFRSVLVNDNLQKMGYTNVVSLDGGWRGWTERGLPVVTPGEGA